MARDPLQRPLHDIENLDLDAGLTDKERAIIAATPFYGLAKVLAGLFLAACVVLMLGLLVQQSQRQRKLVTELQERIEIGSGRVASATPGDLVTLAWNWFPLQRRIRDASVSQKQRENLARAVLSYAQELLERGAMHLSALDYLDAMEVASVAEVMGMMLDTIGPALDTRVYRPLLDRAASTATDAAVQLAGPGATARDLTRAAGLLFRVADLVEPALRAEYTSTASSLLERARLAEERGSLAVAIETGSAAMRAEFASTLSTMLQGVDSAISRVSTTGPDFRTLVIEGQAAATYLADLVLRNAAVRERLLALSFLTVRAVGGNGTVEVDIETMTSRIPEIR